MIREIIHFTENLNKDLTGFLVEYLQPQQEGVYILINNDGVEKVESYKKGDTVSPFLKECALRLKYSWTIEYDKKPFYQKCFDLPNKRIHSISPYVVAFKRTYIIKGKEYGNGKIIDPTYIHNYLRRSSKETNTDITSIELANILEKYFDEIIEKYILNTENKVKDSSYIIFLYDIPIENYVKVFDEYLKLKLFNSSKDGITDKNGKKLRENEYLDVDIIRGWSNFYNGYNADKIFLKHMTSFNLTNSITNREAKLLYDFKEYCRCGFLPNPLPIFVDKEELIDSDIQNEFIKVCNIEEEKTYRGVLKIIMSKHPQTLKKYYLLNMQQGNIVDFDFVPMFRYAFSSKLVIKNITESGFVKDKIFEKDNDIQIDTIFDFERIVVLYIFNNSLVKIKDDKFSTNYFGSLDPNYVSGGDVVYQLIMKYRKVFYDYIYKSKINAINELIFDDIMYHSILSNIQKDEIKGKFEWNNTVKKKINIWFSLYKLFNNNKNTEIMASKVTDLMSKMRSVVKGESILDKPEEFAFGAGQLVSYLIDRSVASNKSYALLEPYLQKTKSNFLQDAIAQTIAVYKHNISTYRGPFQALASNVLTYDGNIELKPMLKYFLAGCFCPCVIYDKKQDNNN